MLTSKKKRLIQESIRSLTRSHAAAIAQIEDTISVLIKTLELEVPDFGDPELQPVVDEKTFSITWQNHTCFLGNTLLFWLFHRLAQSPNQYVPHVELLDDVWHSERNSSTIRGVAKRLRDELIAAGMLQLASAIDGRVSGHYGLIFSWNIQNQT